MHHMMGRLDLAYLLGSSRLAPSCSLLLLSRAGLPARGEKRGRVPGAHARSRSCQWRCSSRCRPAQPSQYPGRRWATACMPFRIVEGLLQRVFPAPPLAASANSALSPPPARGGPAACCRGGWATTGTTQPADSEARAALLRYALVTSELVMYHDGLARLRDSVVGGTGSTLNFRRYCAAATSRSAQACSHRSAAAGRHPEAPRFS